MIGARRLQSDLSFCYVSSYAGPGAAKSKGAAKAVGEIRGKAPLLELLALAPRPPAVSKPKHDAKRKAATNGGAVKPAGKAKGLVKAKALGDVAGAPVLPVACGLIGGGPVLPPPLGPAAVLPQRFLVPRGRTSCCKRNSSRFRIADIS